MQWQLELQAGLQVWEPKPPARGHDLPRDLWPSQGTGHSETLQELMTPDFPCLDCEGVKGVPLFRVPPWRHSAWTVVLLLLQDLIILRIWTSETLLRETWVEPIRNPDLTGSMGGITAKGPWSQLWWCQSGSWMVRQGSLFNNCPPLTSNHWLKLCYSIKSFSGFCNTLPVISSFCHIHGQELLSEWNGLEQVDISVRNIWRCQTKSKVVAGYFAGSLCLIPWCSTAFPKLIRSTSPN